MGKMHGLDISHYNKIIDFNKVEGDFVILKATQGVSFVDPTYKKNLEEFRKRKKLIGHYHFADGKDYKKEAKHFLDNIDLQKGDVIALDFEKYEIPSNNPVAWCYQWLMEIQKKTGIKPLIYLSVSLIHKYNWTNVIKNGNGLWIADYKNAPARTGQWKGYAIRQTTSLGDSKGIIGSVDRDIVNDNPADEVLDYIKEHIYNFGNKINEKEAKEIIKRFSNLKDENKELAEKLSGFRNQATINDKTKDLQLSIKRYKDSLNGYIKKNKELQGKLEVQKKTIDDLANINQENAKNTKIVSALMFFLRSIISKLK